MEIGTNMDLVPKILKYTGNPKDAPISFVYNGSRIDGLCGHGWKTLSDTRERIDSRILRCVITGKFFGGLAVRAEYTEYLDYPVTEWLFFLENRGKKPVHIAYVDVGGFIDGKGKCVLTTGNGDDCTDKGYTFTSEELNEEVYVNPSDGTSCKGAFPYMKMTFGDMEVRAAIGWTSRWSAVFTPGDAGGVTFFCGQERCDTDLYPGERWRTPRLTLMAYTAGGTEYRGINIWRRFYMDHILPKADGASPSPLFCLHNFRAGGMNEFCGATEENQISALKKYNERGLYPDVWWIDAGWYPCGGEWTRTGTWRHDEERFPQGLAPIGKACADAGASLLLWFEPERVRPGSDIALNHPEWLLKRRKSDGTEDVNMLLDLGNPEALSWLTDYVDSLIREYGVKIYRQDFNFDPLPFWEQNEDENRVGMLENRHVQGYYAYWDALLERNPGLRLDSCASGGRRNDLETMRRAFTLHYTDAAYGNHPVKLRQFREMFEWIPYFRSHNMSWDNPDDGGYSGKRSEKIDEFSYMNALAPALTSMVKHDAPDGEIDVTVRMEKVWRRCAELELSGDYYPVTDCAGSPRDWYVCQFDDPRARKGAIIVIRGTQADGGTYEFVPPCICPGAEYSFEIAGESVEKVTIKGRTAGKKAAASSLRRGIGVTLPKRAGAVLFYGY